MNGKSYNGKSTKLKTILTIINGFFDNLGLEKEQLEMIKFQNKINAFSTPIKKS